MRWAGPLGPRVADAFMFLPFPWRIFVHRSRPWRFQELAPCRASAASATVAADRLCAIRPFSKSVREAVGEFVPQQHLAGLQHEAQRALVAFLNLLEQGILRSHSQRGSISRRPCACSCRRTCTDLPST